MVTVALASHVPSVVNVLIDKFALFVGLDMTGATGANVSVS